MKILTKIFSVLFRLLAPGTVLPSARVITPALRHSDRSEPPSPGPPRIVGDWPPARAPRDRMADRVTYSQRRPSGARPHRFVVLPYALVPTVPSTLPDTHSIFGICLSSLLSACAPCPRTLQPAGAGGHDLCRCMFRPGVRGAGMG